MMYDVVCCDAGTGRVAKRGPGNEKSLVPSPMLHATAHGYGVMDVVEAAVFVSTHGCDTAMVVSISPVAVEKVIR